MHVVTFYNGRALSSRLYFILPKACPRASVDNNVFFDGETSMEIWCPSHYICEQQTRILSFFDAVIIVEDVDRLNTAVSLIIDPFDEVCRFEQ